MCVHSQPTLGHFVNGHYAIGPIHHLTRDWGGSNLQKAMAPPPVCVDIYVSETDERASRDPLPPQTNAEKALQQNPQNVDGERPREEEREETCCSSHHTDSQPTEWAAAGIQNPTRGGKEQQMHPKEQNDAVNCFEFFFFS